MEKKISEAINLFKDYVFKKYFHVILNFDLEEK
jgi:hypothetical protein